MLTRVTHSAIAFAITVVVYQAYVLLAAPFIEPPLQTPTTGTALTDRQREAAVRATHKHRELLAAYFPSGHWTLTEPPITAENGQAMIVINEFNPNDNGPTRVRKCAILFFPRGRVRGEPPPTDAVILEAPHGAVLQMDQSARRGVGGIGRIQSGRLTGQITVKSDMREPGPHDDLFVKTHDVEIKEDLIFSRDKVEMRLGPHRGSGRHLEIRLVAVERSRSDTQRSQIGNIDSLEIRENVQAQLAPGQVRLGPGTGPTIGPTDDSAPAPPVNITCGGHFRFDFPKQIASFNKKVLLKQLHPQGKLDQLHCDTLTVNFASTNQTPNADIGSPLGKLQAASIVATSSEEHPVQLYAQSMRASANCERIWVDLVQRRVTFDRGNRDRFVKRTDRPHVRRPQDVELIYQGNEIHARQVQYEAPPENSDQRVGTLLAAGSGWLRALTSGGPDAEPFAVRWMEEMRLSRVNGQPVLILKGRPKLEMVGLGRLLADHLDLYLRESAADGSEADLLPGDVVPDRLVAGGRVDVDSAQLRGEVKQLNVQFEYANSNLLLASPDSSDPRIGRSQLGPQRGARERTYDIVGETLQMLVTVRQRKPEVTSIDVDGQVVFKESPKTTVASRSLEVQADHLRIKNADSPSAQIELTGKPATITDNGMLIRTENLRIHRGASSAQVDAPGEIEMLVDRDLSGKRLATPQPMTIQWQRSMQLEQNRIIFSGDVRVQTVDGTLDTQQLVVQLSAPVQFDGAADQRRVEIAQLECAGGVSAIFSQRDGIGLTSVQTIKLEESFVANLQSGQLSGTGPGWMESVHLASNSNPLGDWAANERLAATRPQPQTAQRLRFLGVQFVRGIQGNLHRRQVAVVGEVEAVYGPVDAWEQRLALTKRGMPGPDTIWITSQRLEVAESPLARLNRSQQSGLGPIELRAAGNVTIEGPVGERGNFTTRSREAKYDQAKRTFILEGNNSQPATMIYQEYRGAPTSPTSARKITYFQDTGNVNIDGLMSGKLLQLPPNR